MKEDAIKFYKEQSKYRKVPIREIAQKFGVTERTINNWLKPYKQKAKETRIDQIQRFYYEEKRNREYNTNYKRNNMSESQRLKREENKRRAAEDAIIMNILKKNQEANAISMSIKSKITDDQIVENNIQEYNCVPKRNGNGYVLVLRDEIRRMRPNDLPERINASKGINVNIKTYHEDR